MSADKNAIPRGLTYIRNYISPNERLEILKYLSTIHPIWERRFSTHREPPEGEKQRWLLRPVYWLGNWQFACLDYFHPPKGLYNRCVTAEPYPDVLAKIIKKIEKRIRISYSSNDVPKDWELNTCLINYYGDKIENGKKIDTARVGEHRDFEYGPVASISFGERALFQFVESHKRGTREGVVWQGWLEDSSLQVFGGKLWKDVYFHRVQRVERKRKKIFKLNTTNFETRRINFTFRYVPKEYFVRYRDLPEIKSKDIQEYMLGLSKNSLYFKSELELRK